MTTAAAIAQPQQPEIPGLHGHWKTTVEGGFRHISIMQLAMTWWLYSGKHLNARQFRMVFALHEQQQRRSVRQKGVERPEKPAYGFTELRRLIGARDPETVTDAALRRDLAKLAKLGLVKAEARSISFATSPNQLTVEDLAGFWQLYEQIPNQRRRVAMPRRTLRALAGGFSRSTSGVILALLIRGMFGHKKQDGYRHDGRAKCSWIAEVFGLGLRSVKAARAQLVDRAWITELPTTQWQKNKWGMHYVIDIDHDWSPGSTPEHDDQKPANDQAVGEGGTPGNAPGKIVKIAPPTSGGGGKSAPPCLNSSPSSIEEELNNSSPAQDAGRSVVSSKKNSGTRQPPKLHDMQPEDLQSFERLHQLYEQAVDRGRAHAGERGRLDFFALAHRAKAHGDNPVRLFAALLRDQRWAWITDSDEDEAHRWIKHHTQGIARKRKPTHDEDGTPLTSTPFKRQRPQWDELSADARVVAACRKAASGTRHSAFEIARISKGFTKDRWDAAETELDLRSQW